MLKSVKVILLTKLYDIGNYLVSFPFRIQYYDG